MDHLVSVDRFELDQIIMALCMIFDVIKQLNLMSPSGKLLGDIIFLCETLRHITLLQGW
jgi:hypothetical protein